MKINLIKTVIAIALVGASLTAMATDTITQQIEDVYTFVGECEQLDSQINAITCYHVAGYAAQVLDSV